MATGSFQRMLRALSAAALASWACAGFAQDGGGELDFLFEQDAASQSDGQPAAEPEEGENAALSHNGAEEVAVDPVPQTTVEPPQAPEPYAETIPLAAHDPAPAERTRATRGRIEEVVVTAQKREESLQDVPIAIIAFSGDTLTNKGITDTQALTRITPGLVYNSNAGYAMAYIRGIGSDAPLPTADPSVATYVDGVYYPMVQSTIQSFADVERIEVLKGPQGTLFGRNTTGGAISVVTKDPGQDQEYRLVLEGGDYSHLRASVYGSAPVTDYLAVSLSAFFDRTDSPYEQTNEFGPSILDTQNWGVRTKVALNTGGFGPVDDFSAVLSGYALDHHGADTNIVNQFRPSALSTVLGGSPTPEPYKASTDLPDTNYTRIEGANLKAVAGLPYFDFVSISAYQNVENYGNVDYDGTPSSIAGFGAHPGLSESFSQELQLVSKDWDRMDVVMGGYYFTGSGGFVPLNFGLTAVVPTALLDPLSPLVQELLPVLTNPLPSIPLPPITIPNTPEVVADLLGVLGNTLPVEELLLRISELGLLDLPGNSAYVALPLASVVDTDAYAAFTQITWRATDWLNLTAGVRYSTEERALVKNEIYAPLIITDPRQFDQIRGLSGTPLVARSSRSESWDDISTKFVVEFPFDSVGFIDSGMLYIGRTEGFKSGTWNVVALTDEPEPVEPEQVVSWEGGFKTDMFGGSVRFNASVFAYDYDNLQLTTIALTSGGAVRLENAGKAKLKGVEFDSVFAPLDGLQIALNGSFIDSRYEECTCSGFEENTGLGFQGDFSGNELVNAPPFSGTADVSYLFDIRGGALELAANYYHNSGHWFDAQNSFEQQAYQLLGGRISYTHSRSNVRFSVYGDNLTDERYLINGNVNDFGRFGTFGMPRTFGMRLQWPAQ